MRARLILRLLAGLAVLGAPEGAGAADLAERLDAALRAPGFRGARVAAVVLRRNDGAVLFERTPDRALIPASNTKILTALGVLDALGPTHRFTTRVYARGAPDGSGAVDDLFVRGGGDPALTSEQWWRLAGDLRLAGLRHVRGDLVLDDSAFDRKRRNADWGPISARAYHAPIGALSANYGAFGVEVRPGGAVDAPAQVAVDPPVPYLALENGAVTGPAESRPTLVVERRVADGHERVVVRGRVPLGSEPRRLHRSVSDPVRYAGAVLRMQLEANGIAVGGRVRPGAVPAAAQELLAFEGRPLGEIVQLFLKWSSNPIGESLVKALAAAESGEPGTWERGLAVLRGRLDGLGVGAQGMRLTDGSGLSRRNRVAPRTLARALRIAAGSFEFGPEFVSALPIAGQDGTLEERADGARDRVRAKTGLLEGVVGLSGYARAPDGPDLVFSILANGYRAGAERAMAAVDGFVHEMVSEAAEPAGGADSLPETELRDRETELRDRAEVVDRAGGG